MVEELVEIERGLNVLLNDSEPSVEKRNENINPDD